MRASLLYSTTLSLAAALLPLASAHTIFQRVSVAGTQLAQLKGVRAPSSDDPIMDVNDGSFACNKNIQFRDNTVISIQAGAKVGTWWGHVIGGAQSAGDHDNPIAGSHKGPVMIYLAKVSDAASAQPTGLKWFKVAETGLQNGQWGVDQVINGGGWYYFTMPSCVKAGDYLMRAELIALHGAEHQGQAQFYMECAQIHINGTGSNEGSDFASFPGTYKATDPGILVNIYDNSGHPNGGGRPYVIPGPRPITC